MPEEGLARERQQPQSARHRRLVAQQVADLGAGDGVVHRDRQPQEARDLPRAAPVAVGEFAGGLAGIVLRFEDLPLPGSALGAFQDHADGGGLAEARRRVERGLLVQGRQHGRRGATVVALEQHAQGVLASEGRREVLRVAEFRVVRRGLLERVEVVAPDGFVDGFVELRRRRALELAGGAHRAVEPEVQRLHDREAEEEGDREAPAASLEHAARAVAAEHHRGEEAGDEEEELHAPAMDEGPDEPQDEALAAVVHRPWVLPKVGDRRVQHDPQQHREAAQGVEVVPAFVRQAGR